MISCFTTYKLGQIKISVESTLKTLISKLCRGLNWRSFKKWTQLILTIKISLRKFTWPYRHISKLTWINQGTFAEWILLTDRFWWWMFRSELRILHRQSTEFESIAHGFSIDRASGFLTQGKGILRISSSLPIIIENL